MATINTQIASGSPLIGNPITFAIQANLYNDPVFHRVKVRVHAGLQGGDYRELLSSQPVSDSGQTGETVEIDVSSALRAVADEYQYTPTPPEYYPYISFYLEAWDEYMKNGELHESAHDFFPDIPEGATVPAAPLRALIGKYSDMERLLAGETKQTNKFSRKPVTSPEVVCQGHTMLFPQNMVVHTGNITHGQQVVEHAVSTLGMQTIEGREVYVVAADRDCYQLRFVNGLGCLESLSVRSLRTTDVNYTKEEHIIARAETFGSFSHGIIRKENDYETWKMSSGALDEAWLSWYLHEFLMAEQVWINLRTTANPLWVRCHIVTDDKATGINRKDNAMLEVEFTLRMDIYGSTMSELSV